jgi:hypothetical protein
VRSFLDLRRDTQPSAGNSLFARLTRIAPTGENLALADTH